MASRKKYLNYKLISEKKKRELSHWQRGAGGTMAGLIPLNYTYPPEPTAGEHLHPDPPKYQAKQTQTSDEEKTVAGKYQRME